MSDVEAKCYLDRYPDLSRAFGSDLNQAKGHWFKFGMNEKRVNECLPERMTDTEAQCYMNRYTDLQDVFRGLPLSSAKKHWVEFGIREKRLNYCDGNTLSCFYPSMLTELAERSDWDILAELAREEEDYDELLDFLL